MSSEEQEQNAIRTGQGSTRLTRAEFEKRYKAQFYDPAYDAAGAEIKRLTSIAWEAYQDSRKSPRTRKAGLEFADPEYDLALDWLEARSAIQEAQRDSESVEGASRILLISASPRTDETCPSEMAKSFRIAQQARTSIERAAGFTAYFLDLSNLNSEYGRQIHPCKACVSTAMPLCHWPCSCYPNYYMGQIHDWMNELYPRWVAAHGVMIITPVRWYQAPSVLKLMMDRLVCADGGNPDPTTTDGKDAAKAKAMELKGWHYPKHLAGRIFSIIAHGDTEGADSVRRSLHDWLAEMELIPAGAPAVFDRYVGYYEPYATSHDALDRDIAYFAEVENAVRTLMDAVVEMRAGRRPPGNDLPSPRPK
jgi:multimeric flavodoxin WrbA